MKLFSTLLFALALTASAAVFTPDKVGTNWIASGVGGPLALAYPAPYQPVIILFGGNSQVSGGAGTPDAYNYPTPYWFTNVFFTNAVFVTNFATSGYTSWQCRTAAVYYCKYYSNRLGGASYDLGSGTNVYSYTNGLLIIDIPACDMWGVGGVPTNAFYTVANLQWICDMAHTNGFQVLTYTWPVSQYEQDSLATNDLFRAGFSTNRLYFNEQVRDFIHWDYLVDLDAMHDITLEAVSLNAKSVHYGNKQAFMIARRTMDAIQQNFVYSRVAQFLGGSLRTNYMRWPNGGVGGWSWDGWIGPKAGNTTQTNFWMHGKVGKFFGASNKLAYVITNPLVSTETPIILSMGGRNWTNPPVCDAENGIIRILFPGLTVTNPVFNVLIP